MAVMQLKKVIAQNPKMVKAYQLLALLYMKYGEWDKARKLLKKASQIDNTNTTTLRYMTAVRQEKGKRPFARIKSDTSDQEEGRSVRYMSGNDLVIAPTTFRDSSTIATVINIFLGIMLGAAIVWFLTVPAVRQSVNDKANRSVTDANTSLATATATAQDLQDQIDSANSDAEAARKERDDANQRIEGYNSLLQVADLYVLGDQNKTVDALGKLNEDDYDGEGKTLYDDITSMVGGALFNQYYTDGTTAYVNKDYAGAASNLQQAVDSDPEGKADNYESALYYLGFAYYFQGDYDSADKVFSQFSDRYPNRAGEVQPYMNGGASARQGTQSQGQASVNTDNAASQSQTDNGAAASQGSAQQGSSTGGDVTVYDNSQTQTIVWTDPVTGQGYDMYGNPVNPQ